MFDPYYIWLGIPPKDQPPNHYRLLAIELFEDNSDVIDAATNRQMAYLQQRATGKHSADSQQLLNEVAAARLCLLKQEDKTEYDLQLRKQLSPQTAKPAKKRSRTENANLSKPPRVLSRPKNSKRSPATSIMGRTKKRTLLKFAVGIGTVGLLFIGYAVWGPESADRSQEEPTNGSSIVSASENDDVVIKKGASPKPQRNSPEAVSPESDDENPAAKQTGTYTIEIQPSDAQIIVKGDGILVTGEGSQRRLAVSESSQSLSFVLTATPVTSAVQQSATATGDSCYKTAKSAAFAQRFVYISTECWQQQEVKEQATETPSDYCFLIIKEIYNGRSS